MSRLPGPAGVGFCGFSQPSRGFRMLSQALYLKHFVSFLPVGSPRMEMAASQASTAEIGRFSLGSRGSISGKRCRGVERRSVYPDFRRAPRVDSAGCANLPEPLILRPSVA